MKYLVRASAKHKTLSYRRMFPTRLQAVAKAAGYGVNYHGTTTCPVDANELRQAQAKEVGDAEYDRIVALLELSLTQDHSGITIVPNKGRAQRLLDRKAVRRTVKGVTVFELLGLWLDAHPEQSAKGLQDRERYWSEFTDAIGNNIAATDNALPEVHRGFDLWQAAMTERGCSSATIQRARNSVASVLRWGAIEYRINWSINLKRLPQQAEMAKAVLTSAEQVRLLRCVVESDGPTAAMVAVMLAGGVMPSEIARLDRDATQRTLQGTRPYVTIGSTSKVKAKARRRVVPLVWDADVLAVIRNHLPEAIDRASVAKDSSATVNKYLRTRGFNVTGHGLRHTLMAVAQSAMANPLVLSRVGGWSATGLNSMMMGYGADVADSELLDVLTTECRRWWGRVISDKVSLKVISPVSTASENH